MKVISPVPLHIKCQHVWIQAVCLSVPYLHDPRILRYDDNDCVTAVFASLMKTLIGFCDIRKIL